MGGGSCGPPARRGAGRAWSAPRPRRRRRGQHRGDGLVVVDVGDEHARARCARRRRCRTSGAARDPRAPVTSRALLNVSTAPPFRVPLFMIATRGRRPCTSAGEFDAFDPVVRDEIQIDVADSVHGAHDVELAVPRQIAEIDRPELPERHDEPRRRSVVGIEVGALVLLLHARARGIGLACRRAGSS